MSLSTVVAGACLLLGLTGPAKAVTVPYSVDFTTGGLPTDFTSAINPGSGWPATWTVTGAPTWQNVMPAFPDFGQVGLTNQTINAPGVAGSDFVQSTKFIVPTYNAGLGSISIGLTALSDNPSTVPWSSFSNWYTASLNINSGFDGNPAGASTSLGITAADGAAGVSLGSLPNAFTFASNTLYELRLVGTYDGGGALSLTVSVRDGTTGTTLASLTSTPSPLTNIPYAGNLFGFANSTSNLGSATIDYSNFNLGPNAVPEPMSSALAGLSSLMLLRRRRES